MEEKLAEMEIGIHMLGDKIVYVDDRGKLKVVKVFDLITQKEETFFFDKHPLKGLRESL